MTKSELFKRLHKVDDINTALLCVQMQIDRLEGCLQGHAIRYDQDKVQTSPKDAVAEVMCDLEGLLKKQARLRIAMTRAVADVAGLIDRVDDKNLSLVMHYRYMACLSWREVADKMGYAESHLFKLHDAAIKKILQDDSK